LGGEIRVGWDWGCSILMVGLLVVGRDSSSNLGSRAFLFWVVMGFEGLGFKGGCFFGFLAW